MGNPHKFELHLKRKQVTCRFYAVDCLMLHSSAVDLLNGCDAAHPEHRPIMLRGLQLAIRICMQYLMPRNREKWEPLLLKHADVRWEDLDWYVLAGQRLSLQILIFITCYIILLLLSLLLLIYTTLFYDVHIHVSSKSFHLQVHYVLRMQKASQMRSCRLRRSDSHLAAAARCLS